jgi:hypothetical protein
MMTMMMMMMMMMIMTMLTVDFLFKIMIMLLTNTVTVAFHISSTVGPKRVWMFVFLVYHNCDIKSILLAND